jgi:anti-sigma regulatory factor (Ser/Thr protein kinase)
MSTEANPSRPARTLLHETLLYPNLSAYLAAVVPFIRDGLAAGEPVLVAVPTPKVRMIADALGDDADRVEFVDLAEQARNPGRLIPTVLRAFLDRYGTRPTRIVSESLWPERQPDEIPVVVRQEALVNRVFASYPTTILCPYDADGLPTQLLSLANRTHPTVVEGRNQLPCGGYADPERVVEVFNERAPDDSPAAVELAYDERTLPLVQALVGDYGARVGLPEQRIADLLAALGEVAGSALPEKGEGTVRVTGRGDRLVCEVRTPGRFDDLLAGLRRPAEDTPRGRGLFVANLLCDLVETHTHDDSSSTRLLLWY